MSCSAASIIAKTTRDAEIEKIKKKIGIDFGSGYTSDPVTCKFLKENSHKYKKEGNLLYQALSSGSFNKAQSLLSSSDPSLEKDRQLLRQRLASIGLLRYFTGV